MALPPHPDRPSSPASPGVRQPAVRPVRIGDRTLSCVDFGGPGRALLALHGTFGRGTEFTGIAALLGDRVRVIAPDQRGHGRSERTADYSRAGFVADAAWLVESLGVAPVAVLGHSLGGITAYQLAARHPELVSALIVEDVGPVMRRPEVAHPVLDVRGWPARAGSREELAAAIEERGVPDSAYFLRSAVGEGDHWRTLFDWTDMMAVQEHGVGDWWADWTGSRCPALVLHGGRSTLLPGALAEEMTARRPGTRLVRFPDAGHWVHDDAPEAVARTIADFLAPTAPTDLVDPTDTAAPVAHRP
ncbi:alpha/beta fold hydrolase [Streptomyces uncialis]|uniref:alpha/beta fold hydrolase n=1 Tax=Streptomyces uncialis TaxID=1048205 RepID=UPI0033E09361